MVSIPKDELKRKAFHQLTLIYVFGYLWLPVSTVLWGLGIAAFIITVFETVRLTVPKVNELFTERFHGFYRSDEINKPSGLFGTVTGAFLTILIFDLIFQEKAMVFASFLYLAFGDAAAALVGRTVGEHKMFSGKSWEGSAACFIVCLICGLFIFDWKFAVAGALIATAVEAVPWKINDNFWMQIINAGLLCFLALILYPGVTAGALLLK